MTFAKKPNVDNKFNIELSKLINKNMFRAIISIAVATIGVLGVLFYKIVYKARNSEHDDERNKGIRG